MLICTENGEECRKSVGIHEACMMALRQDTARLFGLQEELPFRIIGVESGDDDGFISALIECDGLDPEEIKSIIEV